MGTKDNIEHFFKFFEERVAFVESTCLSRIEGTILMCSYLDALAKYRYGGKSSRNRFRDFIFEFGNSRGYWQRLSTWLLYKNVTNAILSAPNGFVQVLNRQFGSNFNYYQLDFNPDIDIEELERRSAGYLTMPWSQEFRDEVAKHDYASILWSKYRNLAVHQTVVDPVAAPEGLSENEDVPFYRHFNQISSATNKISFDDVRFRIPARFVFETLKECLAHFRPFAEKEGLVI